MSWQGIPFKLLEAGNVDQLFFKLASLPKLTIDAPTDYNQLWLTVGATFLGGIIPALIAWRTFHVNAKNVKKERDEQQRFLKSERAKQQLFMMGERASQFASLKEEREVQKTLTQKTINAQVISANRQKWIDDFRRNIAEFCSLAFTHYDARTDYLIHERSMTKAAERYEKSGYSEALKERNTEAGDKFTVCLERSRTSRNDLDRMKFIILLSLNHDEKETHEIKDLIQLIFKIIGELSINDETGFLDNVPYVYSGLCSKTEDLMNVVRVVLKREWEKVKLCE